MCGLGVVFSFLREYNYRAAVCPYAANTMKIFSPGLRKLIVAMTMASVGVTEAAVTLTSSNNPLYILSANNRLTAYENAHMEAYSRSGSRNKYVYTGKWGGDSNWYFQFDPGVTMNGGTTVYLASSPMTNNGSITTTVSAPIDIQNTSADDTATIASGNGGWKYEQKSKTFTSYAPTTETIRVSGTVTGSGYLQLQGSGTTSTTFEFTSTSTSDWFTGVVSMENSRGGKTYLDLTDERWQGAVIDFGLYSSKGAVPTGGTNYNSLTYASATPSQVGLDLSADAAVAALSGGAEGGVIMGNGHELTLKATDGNTYTYAGSLSKDLSLKMAGNYTQVITGEHDLGNITVDSGRLNFTGNVLDADHNSNITVNDGLLLVGTLKEDGTLNPASNAKLQGVDITVTGGGIGVSGGMTASGTLTVSGGAVHSVEGAINAASLVLNGGKIYAGVDANGNSTNVGTSAGINITGNATVTSGALYTDEKTTIGGKLDISGGTLHLKDLTAGELYQSGGELRVTGNATTDKTTIDGITTTVMGSLTAESLTLVNGGDITTGAGTEVGTVTMGSGSVWNNYGTTSYNQLTLLDIGLPSNVAKIHTKDGTSWTAPTHITLDYGEGGYQGYAFTLSSDVTSVLTLMNVLTITGAVVDDAKAKDFVFDLAKLEGMTVPDDLIPTNSGTMVYVLANGKAYQGSLFAKVVNGETILRVGVEGEANNSIVVGSGSNLRISHESDGLYDIYRDATYNATDKTWNSSFLVENSQILPSRIYLNQGSAFYLNDSHKDGSSVGQAGNVIEILPAESAGTKPAHIHVENSIPVWNMGGILTGVGEVHLVAHMTPTSQDTTSPGVTIFRYTNTQTDTADAWFSGTLGLANAHGGDVQLDIGNTINRTRWQNALIDLGPREAECIMHDTTQKGTAANTILLLEGDTAIKGLITSGTPDATHQSRVVTNITSGTGSYTLTLGTNLSASPYVYSGVLGSGDFYTTNTEDKSPQNATSVTGSLNLHKVGSNTQVFTQDTTLNTITIDKGALAFTGKLNANLISVNAGGSLVTDYVADVSRINLEAGSSWRIGGDMMSSGTTLAFSGEGSVYLGNYEGADEAVFYIPVKLNLKDSEGIGYSADKALFEKLYGDTLTINTDNALNFTYTDTKVGDVIYVTNNVMNSHEQSLLQDVEGRFVDVILDDAGNPVDSKRYYAEMNFDAATGQLTATRTDKQVFTWMGEESGTTPGNLCINPDPNLVFGHVWTTATNGAGYTVNTGWHEQVMGAKQGVFVDGAYVDFVHTGIHGVVTEFVDVDIQGAVAPGHIYVNTENIYRGDAREGTPISYGFAFTSNDESGVITDYGGTPTKLVKEGEGMLVIDVDNRTTGGISLRHGSIYAAVPTALGKGEIHMHDDTAVYVNYLHSDDPMDDHRHPVVENNFTLTEGADVTIGFAPFVYESVDKNAQGVQSVTRHWRYMLLDGTFTGDRDSVLRLRSYNSCWIDKAGNTDPYLEMYTGGFILKNSDNAEGGHFHGTVKLENLVNTSQLTGGSVGDDRLNARWTGEVRLQLSDDYLRNAHLDASREGAWVTPLIKNDDGSYSEGTKEFRQTTSQLVMLEGDTTVRGLSATLLGSTPESFMNADTANKYYTTERRDALIKYITSVDAGLLTYDVQDEVDLVHVSTTGDYVLNLNNDGEAYWYSGKLGYKTQYVGTEQVGKTYYDPLDPTTGETLAGTLSLVMTSTKGEAGAQYIHSAELVNLTLRQGTLGFNQLNVRGDVFMNSDTNLKLSVQNSTSNDVSGTTVDTSWKTTDADGLIIYSGQSLTINVLDQDDTPATIDGDVTLRENSGLYFIGNNINADNGVEGVFLDVNGTLTMVNNESLDLSIQGINFPFVGFTPDDQGHLRQTWYIAEADEIEMQGDPLTFTDRIIQLESGYVGLIGVKDEYTHADESTNDYITVTVLGDPRRTWTGNTGNQTIDNIADKGDAAQDNVGGTHEFTADAENNGYKWVAGNFGTDGANVKTSNKWKEELSFFNGCLTLFGNLYNAQSKDDTTVVDKNTALQPGWVTGETEGIPQHFVDDEEVHYQYVQIVGEVAPMMLTVNGSYYDSEGKVNPLVDATNYVFAGSGIIRDVTESELGDFYGYNNLKDLNLIDWKTSLSKEGMGVLVMTNANTYSGGTLLQGGRIVMQNASALGTGTVTISGASVLQADFGDDVDVGETATTSTIKNEVRAFNRDTSGEGFGVTYGNDHYVAALVNDSDKRMIISKLTGQSDANVLLNGHATTAAQRESYRYSKADTYATGTLGTLIGDKYTIGVYEIADASGYYGTIRMQGQSVADATQTQDESLPAPGVGVQLNVANDTNWSHLGLDLSLNNSVSTALYLENGSITLPVIAGEADGGTGVSHVVTTTGGTNNLTINATKTAAYFGNLGFGFYQEEDGTLEYNTGTLNVTKDGAGYQTVGNAELGTLHLNAGKFYVSNILQANSISNKDATSKIRVGTIDGTADAAPHTIVVDKGGILAMSGGNLSKEVLNVTTGAAAEDEREVYMLLTDGATLAAKGDWATSKKIDIHRVPSDADGSEVTINTHHFEVDPWDYNRLGTEAASTAAHIIQLKGDITGDNATVNITNDALDTKGVQTDVVSAQQGYVAIKDINQVTNSTFNITDMATLQLTAGQSNTSASSVQVNIAGTEATLHLLENKQTAAQSVSIAHSGGQVLVGGKTVTYNKGHTGSDRTEAELIIRAHKEDAELTNVVMVSEGNTYGTGNGYKATLDRTNGAQQAILDNAIVAAMDYCTVNLNNVLVTDTSVINGGNELLASSTPTSIAKDAASSKVSAQAVTMGYENTTVQISTSHETSYTYGSGTVYHVLVDQFNNVNVGGAGVTLQLAGNLLNEGYKHTVIALQVSGDAGQFLYESQDTLDNVRLAMPEGYVARLITSGDAAAALNLQSNQVTDTMLYITVESVPEPTTTTLSLLALTALMARRRRK